MSEKLDIKLLIGACIKQDRSAQKQFYLLTADKLMNVSRRYTTDLHEAKDVLQNAYIKIFKCLNQFDIHKGNLDGWLIKIVINEGLQLLRKNAKHLSFSRGEVIDRSELTAPDILARLHAEDILNILNKLPEGYRVILNMNVVEGYSHKEIAPMLGIGESTSRSQLARAKKLMRVLINENEKAKLC